MGVRVNVHAYLPHMRMLRHASGLGWSGGVVLMFVLTLMLTCRACACYVTPGVWGGVGGCVNVRVHVNVNLPRMCMLRDARGLGWGGFLLLAS